MPLTPPARFANLDLYTLFSIPRTASTKEISSAYRKLSLKLHPDQNHSLTASEEFAYISAAHKILTNEETRKIYDETGSLDEEASGFPSDESAVNYWRNVFPKITREEIEKFAEEYKGSDSELEDIRRVVNRSRESKEKKKKVELMEVFESVPFADLENLERLLAVLKDEFGVEYSEKQVKSFEKKWSMMLSSEAEEAEEEMKKLFTKQEQKLLNDSSSSNKSNGNKGEDSSDSALISILKARNAEREKKSAGFLSSLEAKYRTSSKHPTSDLADEEFEAFQKKLLSDSTSSSASKNSKKQKVKK